MSRPARSLRTRRSPRRTPWTGLTPEQRSTEMKRRHQVAQGILPAKNGKNGGNGSLTEAVLTEQPNRRQGLTRRQSDTPVDPMQAHLAYLFGKCEALIEHYASEHDLPYAPLTFGVSRLLAPAVIPIQ